MRRARLQLRPSSAVQHRVVLVGVAPERIVVVVSRVVCMAGICGPGGWFLAVLVIFIIMITGRRWIHLLAVFPLLTTHVLFVVLLVVVVAGHLLQKSGLLHRSQRAGGIDRVGAIPEARHYCRRTVQQTDTGAKKIESKTRLEKSQRKLHRLLVWYGYPAYESIISAQRSKGREPRRLDLSTCFVRQPSPRHFENNMLVRPSLTFFSLRWSCNRNHGHCFIPSPSSLLPFGHKQQLTLHKLTSFAWYL